MARKDHQGNGDAFRLARGRMAKVVSQVQTLKFDADGVGDVDSANGEVNGKGEYVVNPARLKDAKGNYKYRTIKNVPCPQFADEETGQRIAVTADNLGEIVAQFARDLDAYDAAGTIVVPRKLKDGTFEDVSGQRNVTLCVDSESDDAGPVSAAEYIIRILRDAHDLSLQKRFYRPARKQAIADFRASDGIAEPAKKARAKKVTESGDEEVAV